MLRSLFACVSKQKPPEGSEEIPMVHPEVPRPPVRSPVLPTFENCWLLQLPLLVLERIFQLMDPIDLFFFTFACPDFANAVMQLKVKIFEMQVCVQPHYLCVYVQRYFPEQRDRHLERTIKVMKPSLENAEHLNFSQFSLTDGKVEKLFRIDRHESGLLVNLYEAMDNSPDTIEWIYHHIRKIFNQSFLEFIVSDVPSKQIPPTIFKDHFHFVQLYNEIDKLDYHDLSRILENFKIVKLDLHWEALPGVKWLGPLKNKSMFINNASWLTLSSLLKMECCSFRAHNLRFTVEEMAQFVQAWVEGGLENLEQVELYHDNIWCDWNSILDGFDVGVIDPEILEKNELLHLRDDVKELRSNNGKRAAVSTQRGRFLMNVLQSI